jgi:peptide/nickel transport system substrate-binding protein
MRRRDMLKVATGAAAILSAPHIARAEHERTLRFVPGGDLSLLDPVFTSFRATHNHAYLVFDTLYGLDESLTAQPQMVEGHTVENDGTLWTLRLREKLEFHDGSPVLARDAVASIRRFGARDPFGQALMAVTDELSAPSDSTLRFRLTKPFPHLPAALAGSSSFTPCIMPERLANTDPFHQVTEMVGSGPYRFLPAEFNAGARSTYARFTAYSPRGDGALSYTAGPKVAHFDRVEWLSVGDTATATAALLQGEVDWLDYIPTDQATLLARNQGVTVEVKDAAGSIPIMRFNHLYPPFDNPAVRRALLGAIDQADVMNAIAGADRTSWHDRIGLFGPGSPMANEAGIDALSSPRDYDKVKRDLMAAGYRGEPIVVLAVSGNPLFEGISQVGTDQLRKAGMNVDLQTMDLGTMFRRRASKEPRDKGGWNVFFTFVDGMFSASPATLIAIRGNGKSAMDGWPDSPTLEALHEAWLDTADADAQRRIAIQMQLQMWQDVPYIPMGHFVRSTAHRRNIIDLPWGFAAFYGVRRV